MLCPNRQEGKMVRRKAGYIRFEVGASYKPPLLGLKTYLAGSLLAHLEIPSRLDVAALCKVYYSASYS